MAYNWKLFQRGVLQCCEIVIKLLAMENVFCEDFFYSPFRRNNNNNKVNSQPTQVKDRCYDLLPVQCLEFTHMLWKFIVIRFLDRHKHQTSLLSAWLHFISNKNYMSQRNIVSVSYFKRKRIFKETAVSFEKKTRHNSV